MGAPSRKRCCGTWRKSFGSSSHLGCTGSPFSTLLVSTTMNQIYVLIIYQIYVLNSVYASI